MDDVTKVIDRLTRDYPHREKYSFKLERKLCKQLISFTDEKFTFIHRPRYIEHMLGVVLDSFDKQVISIEYQRDSDAEHVEYTDELYINYTHLTEHWQLLNTMCETHEVTPNEVFTYVIVACVFGMSEFEQTIER